MENKNTSRRDFLFTGLLATAAVTGCSDKKNPFAPEENVVLTGEKVKLLSVDGEIIEVDKAFLKPVPELPKLTNSEERKGIPGKKFVMVIDLSRCKNLKKCQEACNHAHHVQDAQNWIKVYPMQDAEKTAPYWQPTTCMHCDEPPCVKVCPVDATFKRQDGIVLIDSDRCIGCRFCMAACPYSTRVFNWGDPNLPAEIASKDYDAETSIPQKKGTVGKCDFCTDRSSKGLLPACVVECPNGAILHGDELEDVVTNGEDTFRLKKLLQDRSGYRQFEELGTQPRVYYLPPVKRNFPFEDATEAHNTKE